VFSCHALLGGRILRTTVANREGRKKKMSFVWARSGYGEASNEKVEFRENQKFSTEKWAIGRRGGGGGTRQMEEEKLGSWECGRVSCSRN